MLSRMGLQLLPSLAIAVGLQHEAPAFFHSWVGVSAVPRPEVVTGFVAGGVEIDIKDIGNTTETTVVPTLRAGISVCEKPRSIPIMSLYALAGFKRSPLEGNALRTGIGVTFPALLPLAEAGIPTMFEGTADVGPLETIYSFRVGWSF
jgi:hypothetical protein